MKLDLSNRNLTGFSNYDLNQHHSQLSITIISLASNILSSIPKNLLQFINLKKIDFGHNHLSSIDFKDLPISLQWISFKDNRIGKLLLSKHDIDHVPLGIADNYSNLQYLDLSSNELTTLPGFFASSFTNLKTLFLNDNLIKELPEKLPSKLVHLDLRDNNIQSFDVLRPLKSLHSLLYLKCKGNPIEEFETYSFICGNLVSGLIMLDDNTLKNPKRLEDASYEDFDNESEDNIYTSESMNIVKKVSHQESINQLKFITENGIIDVEAEEETDLNEYNHISEENTSMYYYPNREIETSIPVETTGTIQSNDITSLQHLNSLPNYSHGVSTTPIMRVQSTEYCDNNSVTNLTPTSKVDQEQFYIDDDPFLGMQPRELDEDFQYEETLPLHQVAFPTHSQFIPENMETFSSPNSTAINGALSNGIHPDSKKSKSPILKPKSPASRSRSPTAPWIPPGIAPPRKSRAVTSEKSPSRTNISKLTSPSKVLSKQFNTVSPEEKPIPRQPSNNSKLNIDNSSFEKQNNVVLNQIIEENTGLKLEIAYMFDLLESLQLEKKNLKENMQTIQNDVTVLKNLIQSKSNISKDTENTKEVINPTLLDDLKEVKSNNVPDNVANANSRAVNPNSISSLETLKKNRKDASMGNYLKQPINYNQGPSKENEEQPYWEETNVLHHSSRSPNSNLSDKSKRKLNANQDSNHSPSSLNKSSHTQGSCLTQSRKSLNSSSHKCNPALYESVSVILSESDRLRKDFQPEYLLTPIQVTDRSKPSIMTGKRIESDMQSNLHIPGNIQSFDEYSMMKEDRFETGRLINATKNFTRQLRSPSLSPSAQQRRRSRTRHSWRQNSLKDYEDEYAYQKQLDKSFGSLLDDDKLSQTKQIKEEDSSFTQYHEQRTGSSHSHSMSV